ncbi:MAG: preprotein translocase subunit SecE [Candidatus Margulisiibacteriota bacterium]
MKDFFADYRAELRHVTWPSREVVVRASVLIVLMVFAAVIYVGVLDMIFAKGVLLLKLQ